MNRQISTQKEVEQAMQENIEYVIDIIYLYSEIENPMKSYEVFKVWCRNPEKCKMESVYLVK